MIAKIKRILTSTVLATAFLAPAMMPATAHADIKTNLCKGANLSVTDGTCEDPGVSGQSINNLITRVINIFSVVVGVIAVIMIIIGGLKYIMSGGDSGNVTGAKNTILYAIIGLVIVALAQAIVKFVLSNTPTA